MMKETNAWVRGRCGHGMRIALPLLVGASLLGGCDCERAKKEMDATANQGFSEVWMCCKAIQKVDPAAGLACFNDLKAWRMELTTLIVQWYQACLDGNQSLADSLLRTMRNLFAQQPGGGTCGIVVADGRGQLRTAGLPIRASDLITFDGEVNLIINPLGGDDFEGAPMYVIAGTAALQLEDLEAAMPLRGAFSLAEGTLLHSFALTCELPGGAALTFTLDAPDDVSRLVPSAAGEPTLLTARCRVALHGQAPLLLPGEVWVELPLNRRPAPAQGFTLAEGKRPLRSVLPPAWGFADFNRDGFVDEEDLLAYFTAPEEERDLDLDGDADVEDDALFLAAWEFAVGS